MSTLATALLSRVWVLVLRGGASPERSSRRMVVCVLAEHGSRSETRGATVARHAARLYQRSAVYGGTRSPCARTLPPVALVNYGVTPLKASKGVTRGLLSGHWHVDCGQQWAQ